MFWFFCVPHESQYECSIQFTSNTLDRMLFWYFLFTKKYVNVWDLRWRFNVRWHILGAVLRGFRDNFMHGKLCQGNSRCLCPCSNPVFLSSHACNAPMNIVEGLYCGHRVRKENQFKHLRCYGMLTATGPA